VAERLPSDQPELLAQVLHSAGSVEKEWEVRILAAVAAALPSGQRPAVLARALAVAQAIMDNRQRANALAAVADRLPSEQRPAVLAQALAAAQAFMQEEWRWSDTPAEAAFILEEVSERLASDQSELLARVLAAAQRIPDERWRAWALRAVATRLPSDQSELLAQAWQALVQVAGADWSADALAVLVNNWSGLSAATGKTEAGLLSETLRAFSRAGRSQCLAALGALAPLFDRLGGPPALQGVAQAIADTAKWWP
jgi:hypothetical protein